jgi:sulfite reductase (NADPH) hemoprotein beta-component
MYKYDEIDQQIVDERVTQYRDQVRRYLAGELSEDEFRPLRLQNGLYIQRHAPMLRIAVPYGMLSSKQLRKLGDITKRYDKGYGHFSTRQNLQLNWPKLEDTPDILAELATVEMHAIQTSGNCIRNITTDQFVGIAPDEVIDPRAIAEIMRQWSTFHPEFALLPRKFKIAVSGTKQDRAIVQAHDIGLEFYRDATNQVAIKVWVGGGLGRTPILGSVIREHLDWQHALTYCEAIIRVYNLHGRRDNMYKARIKILSKAIGINEFRNQVEAEWTHLKDGPNTITEAELARVAKHFEAMPYETLPDHDVGFEGAVASNPAFAAWVKRCVHAHKQPGYRAVTLSLKPHGQAPGDITSEQMWAVADLADEYSFGELRSSHEQNLILADVKLSDLFVLWEKAKTNGLATPNIGLLTDIICCPGGDFCSLANAKSIPIAKAIQMQFDDLDYLHDIGDIELNISGCMNACGHHHVGHIGILGVDKDGSEW